MVNVINYVWEITQIIKSSDDMDLSANPMPKSISSWSLAYTVIPLISRKVSITNIPILLFLSTNGWLSTKK